MLITLACDAWAKSLKLRLAAQKPRIEEVVY